MATNQFDTIEKWPARVVKLLGKKPDREVAALLGLHAEAARRMRARLRIPAFRPVKAWTPERDAILLGHSNAEAAQRLGVSRTACSVRRSRLAAEQVARGAGGR